MLLYRTLVCIWFCAAVLPCQAQLVAWGRGNDGNNLTLDVGLFGVNALPLSCRNCSEKWTVPWDGLTAEYDFRHRQISLLYSLNTISILPAFVAIGPERNWLGNEAGINAKAGLGGMFIWFVVGAHPFYSYRYHDYNVRVDASLALGMPFPLLGQVK